MCHTDCYPKTWLGTDSSLLHLPEICATTVLNSPLSLSLAQSADFFIPVPLSRHLDLLAQVSLSFFLAVRSMATKPSTASPLLSLPFPSVPYPILKEHTHYTMHGISFKLNFARYYRPIRRVTSDVELNVVVGRRCLCVNVASVLSRRCCCCCC